MSTEKIVLLLDVDGVVNDFSTKVIDSLTGQLTAEHLSEFNATTEGRTFTIRFEKSVMDRLVAYHNDGLLEIRWLTTWAHDANSCISPHIGLPTDLVVADDEYRAANEPNARFSQDWRHMHGWWKAEVTRSLHESEPATRIIWLDDDLAVYAGSEYIKWLTDADEDKIFALAPYPSLSHGDLDAIEEWIAL